MKALLLTEAPGPEQSIVAEVPTPDPGPREVRATLKAAATNFHSEHTTEIQLIQPSPGTPLGDWLEQKGLKSG